MGQRFVHLHVHSHYSFLDGLAKIDELVARAKELEMEALALTDHGGLWGAVEFYHKAKAAGIKPIIGAELYVATRTRHDRDSQLDSRRFHLTVLAKNFAGYQNLVKLVTKSHLEGFYWKPRVDKELLSQHREGLIALSGCLSGEIPRAIQHNDQKRAERLVAEYREIFGQDQFFLELGAYMNIPEQKKVAEALKTLGRKFQVPLVATADSHYLRPEDKEAHEVLLSIQTGQRFDDEGRLSLKADDFSVKSAQEMYDIFKDVPEAVEQTVAIAEQCNLELPLGKIQLPEFPVPEGYTPDTYLQKLCDERFTTRYTTDNPEARDRLSYELSVIAKTGFAPYFLIVQDFVNWAKAQGIVVGPGRGSAAGSLAAYVLGITNIDPLRYELLFERFLNPERVSMPDIDLDFADWRRDEVIQYLRHQWGDEHVAQIGTFGTMAARAVVRDAGRSLGFPYSFCDRVAKLIPFGMSLAEALEASQELKDAYDNEPDVTRLIDAGQKLEGVARHVSTHACGVVISKEPLTNLVPLQHPSQSEEHVITQYEMHAIEDLGLLKMDLLGLRNLSIIEETLNRIKKTHGESIDIDAIALDDGKTFALLQAADTTGVFQLEGGGMRRYFKELNPTRLEDIISMIALFRPGPMDSIPDFIAAKHGKKKVAYLHPSLKPILEKTYGVIVTQEQVLEIAREFSGFTYSEADILRKAVGKKIKSLLDEQKEKFVSGAVQTSRVSRDLAERVWNFIEPFARYGFNRAHAACYAMIGYQTAWLKAHYPYEFIASLLNREYGAGVERVAVLIQEARAHAIPVLPPDVNASREGFIVVYDEKKSPVAIRFGLTAIKNLGHNVVSKIIAERDAHGLFTSLENFAQRVAGPEFTKKALESLAYAGALDRFAERKAVLENGEQILAFARESFKTEQSGQANLFDGSSGTPALRLNEARPATREERLRWEKEHLGLWVSEHPLRTHERLLATIAKPVVFLRDATVGTRVRIGGVITHIKKILTRKGEPMLFVNMEDMSGSTEVVVFPRVLENYPTAFRENAVVLLDGTVSERNGEMGFICERAEEIVEKAEEIVRKV